MASENSNNKSGDSSSSDGNANASAVLENLLMDSADVRKHINSGRFKLASKTDSKSTVWKAGRAANCLINCGRAGPKIFGPCTSLVYSTSNNDKHDYQTSASCSTVTSK